MNKKLLLIIIPLGLAFFTSPVMAEKNHFGRHDVGQRVEQLTQELGLSEDQKGKVEALLIEQNTKIQAIHEETHKAFVTIFTPEQLAKLDELHKKHQDNQSPHGH